MLDKSWFLRNNVEKIEVAAIIWESCMVLCLVALTLLIKENMK